jgi:hypothetical protein
MSYRPCLNVSCKSHGKPHPHCECYSTGFAVGGEIHYCARGMPHKEDCEYYADGGEVEQNTELMQNPNLAVDGAIASHGLHHLLTKTGKSKSPDQFAPMMDFIAHSKKGANSIESHFSDSHEQDVPNSDIDNIKNYIETIHEDPDKLLDIGGSIGKESPLYASAIAAKGAQALNYLAPMKPLGSQRSPFDKILPPSRFEKAKFDRHLEIAQNPLSIINRAKQGRVSPGDLITLNTLYPQLADKIRAKATEAIAKSHENGSKLNYHYRQGLSMLLGQPLDSSFSQANMQAIIQAQSQAPARGSQAAKQQQKRATGVELKQINQVNRLDETPLQRRQIDQKS